MKKVIVFSFVFVISLVVANTVCAFEFEFEPYIKYGTIGSDESDHPKARGNKVIMGIGLIVATGERFKKTLGIELWTMAEPTDEDREIPSDGIAFSGRVSYDFPCSSLTIYPFAGVGFERWRRNSPEGEQDRFYGDLYFANTALGVGAKYKNLYLETGGFLPVWSDTDSGQRPSGRLGLTLNAGVMYKRVNFGFFYTQKKFGGDGSQTDFQMKQYGLSIGCQI